MKYNGITIGCCLNNATQITKTILELRKDAPLPDRKKIATTIILLTKELLEALAEEGLAEVRK